MSLLPESVKTSLLDLSAFEARDPLYYQWIDLKPTQVNKAMSIIEKTRLKYDKNYKLQQDILNELGINEKENK